jgi:hypothetical protein
MGGKRSEREGYVPREGPSAGVESVATYLWGIILLNYVMELKF